MKVPSPQETLSFLAHFPVSLRMFMSTLVYICTLINYLLILNLHSPTVSALWDFIALYVWFRELILLQFYVIWKLRQFHISVSLYEISSYCSLWSIQVSWNYLCSLCALQFLPNQNDHWFISVYEHYISCEVTKCPRMFSYVEVIRFWKSSKLYACISKLQQLRGMQRQVHVCFMYCVCFYVILSD